MDVVVARPGRFRRSAEGEDVHLYHVGNDPVEHGWIVEALSGGPEWSSCTSSSCTISSRGSPSPAATSRATALRSSASGARKVASSVSPSSRAGSSRSGRRAPRNSRSRTGVLDAATGLIVHSRYVEGLARDAGYERLIRQVPMPAWPVPPIVPEPIARRPGDRLLRPRQREQAHPAVARGVRAAWTGRAVCCWSAPGRRACPGSSCLPNVIRRDYVAEDELWRLLAACDAVVSLRWPTMGETSAAAIRALSSASR